ncbi:ABC transporter, partial [Hortaea werneckii]
MGEKTPHNVQRMYSASDEATNAPANIPPRDDIRSERLATFKDYLRIFTFGTRWDLMVGTIGMLAAAGCGVTQPLMFVFFGDFVGEFSSFVAEIDDESRGSIEDTINELCLYVLALFLARFLLGSIHKFAFRMIGIRLSSGLRLCYLKHLFDQSVQVLDSLPTGHAVGTITSSSNTLQSGISEKLGTFIEYSALIIASLIVALAWNWELALVTVAGFVVLVLVVGTLFPLIVRGQARQAASEKDAASIAGETLASIRMVMACGAQDQVVDKYNTFVAKAKKAALATSPLTSLQFALTFFGVFGIVALTFCVLLCLTTIFFSFDRISGTMQSIGKATVAACDFFAVIDAPFPKDGACKDPHVSPSRDIVFDKVTFAYPSRPDVKILDQLSLTIQAGKSTAIVGPSGSGKSTIVGLIERWYTLKQQHVIPQAAQQGKSRENAAPEKNEINVSGDGDGGTREDLDRVEPLVGLQGSITVDGCPIDDVDVKWWRAQIGLVQQEPCLFNDTIYENVARGLVGTEWETASESSKKNLVNDACEEAFAHEFIGKLPQGYDTKVGDSGARLSGGQRQRIAIARSIVKKPTILILDEATSAIDVRGERTVQAALDKASRNRTTIIIAHRLSTIKRADRIVVLKKGAVIESGTHETLVNAHGGVYASLVSAQALSLGSTSHDIEGRFDTRAIASSGSTEHTAISSPGNCKIDAPMSVESKDRAFIGSFGLLFLESRTYWPWMIFCVLISAAAGTAQPLYAWLFSRSISLFRWQDDHSKLMGEVDFMSIMWTVFAAAAGVAYFLTFRAAYFDQDDHSHGTLVSRVRDDPLKLEEMMGTNIAQVCIAIFNVVGGLILALSYSWKLALVVLSAIIPVCMLSGYIRFRYELQFEKMNDDVFTESSQFAAEAIGAFRTVTSLTLEDSINRRFANLCNGHVALAQKKARW